MRRWGKGKAGDVGGAILFFALAASCAFALSCFLMTTGEGYGKAPEDYLLMTVQCALGLLGMALPLMADRKWNLQLPDSIFVMYYAFLFCAVFLGEVFAFYYLIPYWDAWLHFFSGVMLSMLGFVLAERAGGRLIHPLLSAAFAFSFSLSFGALWEIYEYIMDGLLHMNMQKFADAHQRFFTGRHALRDTMKEVIIDALAALMTAIAGYVKMVKRMQLYGLK